MSQAWLESETALIYFLIEGTEDQQKADNLKDFIKSHLEQVEVKDAHKVGTIISLIVT